MPRRDARIVVLTGAGISRESGLDTFRDAGGLWSRVRLEDVATPDAFRRDPDMVHDFHNSLRRSLPGYEPNAAHAALARLEREHAGPVLVVTQNVGDLHERAGSRALVHMHGELNRARCQGCGSVFDWRGDLGRDSVCPDCNGTACLRPHVVWFHEIPLAMARIEAALAACDLFVSIGTSGTVYPAAGFVSEVRRRGQARTLELNLEPSDGSSLFDESRLGPATRLVPDFVETVLREGA